MIRTSSPPLYAIEDLGIDLVNTVHTLDAFKSQIWITDSVYVLVAIIKKRFDMKTDLYSVLQVLSLSLFEKLSSKQINYRRKFHGSIA